VHRLRAVAHDYLLPLVISGLILRALIPAGFMPGGVTLLTAALCNAPLTGETRYETLPIPDAGLPAGMAKAHCDFCLAPLWGAALAGPTLARADAIGFQLLPARADAPQPRFARDRANIPRAPPPA
jgi:hypothetical protein